MKTAIWALKRHVTPRQRLIWTADSQHAVGASCQLPDETIVSGDKLFPTLDQQKDWFAAVKEESDKEGASAAPLTGPPGRR